MQLFLLGFVSKLVFTCYIYPWRSELAFQRDAITGLETEPSCLLSKIFRVEPCRSYELERMKSMLQVGHWPLVLGAMPSLNRPQERSRSPRQLPK